jgi:hypothetical protein
VNSLSKRHFYGIIPKPNDRSILRRHDESNRL